eukprot:365102-Chlamydomonas_euryale.AAC.8
MPCWSSCGLTSLRWIRWTSSAAGQLPQQRMNREGKRKEGGREALKCVVERGQGGTPEKGAGGLGPDQGSQSAAEAGVMLACVKYLLADTDATLMVCTPGVGGAWTRVAPVLHSSACATAGV